MTPFYDRDGITVYCGDVRDVLPQLDLSEVGCVIADPPYGETELQWDRWPDGWPLELADCLAPPGGQSGALRSSGGLPAEPAEANDVGPPPDQETDSGTPAPAQDTRTGAPAPTGGDAGGAATAEAPAGALGGDEPGDFLRAMDDARRELTERGVVVNAAEWLDDLAAAGTPAQENGPTREGREVEAASPSGVPRSPVAADSFQPTETEMPHALTSDHRESGQPQLPQPGGKVPGPATTTTAHTTSTEASHALVQRAGHPVNTGAGTAAPARKAAAAPKRLTILLADGSVHGEVADG